MRNRKYGDGKSIIEILNIGFEPLLTDYEYKIFKKIGRQKKREYSLKKALEILNKKKKVHQWYRDLIPVTEMKIQQTIELRKSNELLFKLLLNHHKNITRKLHIDREYSKEDQYRNIAIFESSLTRVLGIKDMEHSDDLVSVVTYYTEIFYSIMHHGFMYKDKKFVFFTAGAGQTRNKKSTFISEEALNKYQNTLFCGLTREKVNELGGMNTNKFLAYTSLCQTNSAIWEGFDIDRAIVVPDIEYELPEQEVRYIYVETQEDKDEMKRLKDRLAEITREQKEYNEIRKKYPEGYERTKEEVKAEVKRKQDKKDIKAKIDKLYSKYHRTEIKKMPIKIPFTDGFGISLVKMQSSMIRLPYVKGLISYLDRGKFKKWCLQNGYKIGKITDIYGKEYSIDEVDYIFTESQFKMYKYYKNVEDENGNIVKTGWEVYKENFKKYNCEACVCNVEGKVKLNAKTNYQILQTLTTEMTEDDIRSLASYDIDNLNGIGRDVQCMLNVLGANEDKNERLSWLQKSLILYPEMLKDMYVKNKLLNTKKSMIKKFRSGKFSINGAYTFAIPDPVACLQWWFCGERDLDKLGVLNNKEICCHLFKDKAEVDCLRSPHLDHAHCIRHNRKDKETKLMFESKGIYIAVKDDMSKLLMYDNDGDHLLVHDNKTIISCAKRFQKKYGMIPNYYDMPKANPEQITDDTLFNGIVMAYHHGNIGTPSNEITKVFAKLGLDSTKEEVEEAIEVVALRCCDVNFTIDYAKTLYKPEIPKDVINRYKKYSKDKVPHFFKYAKNKKNNQVAKKGNGNIDKIFDIVRGNTDRIRFKELLGRYSYLNLMNQSVDIATIPKEERGKVVEMYYEIANANERKLQYKLDGTEDAKDKKKLLLQLEFDSEKQREMFFEYFSDLTRDAIVNILVKELNKEIERDLLWRLFGEDLYNNLTTNLEGTAVCKKCHERFPKEDLMRGMCRKCRGKDVEENDGMEQRFCVDCGVEFFVKVTNRKKCRCDDCQKEYRKKYQKELMRKRKNEI